VILDVGGDPAGCRTLGRFEERIKERGYQMQLVVNTMRPFTSSAAEILQMKDGLEFTSRLKVTELVCNTNLMEFTDQNVLEEGIAITQSVADLAGLSFSKYLVLDAYSELVGDGILGKKREVMTYTLKKPWEMLISKRC